MTGRIRSHLVAARTWSKIPIGEIKLLDTKRAVKGVSSGTQHCPRAQGQRCQQLSAPGARVETHQVSSSSSMKESWGAMVTV
jgi:hypothetical protein